MKRLLEEHGAYRLEQQRAGRDAEPAADHDDVGVEEVDERGDRGAEVATDALEQRVTLLDEVARARAGAERAASEPVGGGARAVGLDVAVPGARALAGLPALDDHHVSHF